MHAVAASIRKDPSCEVSSALGDLAPVLMHRRLRSHSPCHGVSAVVTRAARAVYNGTYSQAKRGDGAAVVKRASKLRGAPVGDVVLLHLLVTLVLSV